MTNNPLAPGDLANPLERYDRQLRLDEVGPDGQSRLSRARVLIVGAGGLGSPAALYLAAAGVGTLGLVDDDVVALSNLQRQILHGEADIGTPKVESAERRLAGLNATVHVETYTLRLDDDTTDNLVQDYDIAIGCLDSFASRYCLDAACVRAGKPHVFGAVWGFEGQVGVFGGGGACYRCFFREPPEQEWNRDGMQGGIIGPVAGTIGCLQALETMKIILGAGQPLQNRLVLMDGLRMRFREVSLRRNPDCPVCAWR